MSIDERKQRRLDLTRQIRKLVKHRLRQRREQTISKVLTDFKGVSSLAAVCQPKEKQHIAAVRDEQGHEHVEQEDIAEVFASFYETLYSTKQATIKLPGEGP